MRVQLIFNPASGRYSPRRIGALARAFERHGATVTPTATGRAPPEIDAGADHVVVVGGDGTVRHVAHAAGRLAEPPLLSAYPGGTVNLLAREWAGARAPAAFAARVLARREVARFAVGWGGGSFLCCAGAGWESVAVAGVGDRWKRAIGRGAYLLSAAAALARWRRPAIALEADGVPIACEGFHVARGVHYAGRYRLVPRAIGHEPVMHVVALRRARRRDLLRFWWTLFVGGDVGALPNVAVVECRVLRASGPAAMPVQADGDVIGTLPIVFEVARTAIRMC